MNYGRTPGATANLGVTKETSVVAALASVFIANERKKGSIEGILFLKTRFHFISFLFVSKWDFSTPSYSAACG